MHSQPRTQPLDHRPGHSAQRIRLGYGRESSTGHDVLMRFAASKSKIETDYNRRAQTRHSQSTHISCVDLAAVM